MRSLAILNASKDICPFAAGISFAQTVGHQYGGFLMSIISANPVAVGIVKSAGHGITSPKSPGTPDIGKGSVALSDGRTPGKTPASEQLLPIIPKILNDPAGSGVDVSI
jgi:hypothetical protein